MLEKFKKWFYEWQNGHPFLLHEEIIIACNTRTEEEFLHLNDVEIQTLTQIRVIDMYEKKYPDAKMYSLKFKKK